MRLILICFFFLTACASSPVSIPETTTPTASISEKVPPIPVESAEAADVQPNVPPKTEPTTRAATPPTSSSATHLNRYISRNTVRGIDFGATISRVAFGSDANQDKPEPIWKTLETVNPDLFIFMGNNVFANMAENKTLPDQYRQLDRIAEYKSFRMKVPFMAIWDTRDIGSQNADATFTGKDLAKNDFLNYWTYVRNSLPMEQLQKGGLFHAKIIGPKNKIVQVLMLDTRYYRAPLKDSKTQLLGEDQWRWLERQLKEKANLRLLVSHLPMVTDKDSDIPSWNAFAREKERFYELLRKTTAKNVVILSGDSTQWRVAKEEIRGWGTLYNITPGPLNAEPNEAGTATFGFGVANIDWSHGLVKFEIRAFDNKSLNSFDFHLKK